MSIPFISRKRSQCAYIVDERELLVCGEVTLKATGSWCPEHFARCFIKGANKRPITEDFIHLWPRNKKGR
jgi:hypothetical protein